jgi:hypothetical protein
MRTPILTGIAALMLSAPAGAAPATLIVAMKDPGCHWFYTGGGPNHRKYVKTIVRTGPVTLVNLNEAALIIKRPSRHQERARGREADAQGKGRLQDHDGQAGA